MTVAELMQSHNAGPQGPIPAAANQAATQAAVSGAGSPMEAQTALQANGFADAADAFHKQQIHGTMQGLSQRWQKVALDAATLRMGRALLGAVHDEVSYQVFRRVIRVMGGPQMADGFGPNYAAARPKIADALAHSTMVARHVHAHSRALDLVRKALMAESKAGRGAAEAHPAWQGAVGTALSTARNDDEWRGVLDQMRSAGAPSEVLNRFDTVYSPDGAAKAQNTAGDEGLPTFERFAASASRAR